MGPDANGDSASAGGAVQPGPRQPNCSGIVGANACKDIPVPDVTTETQCHESVYTLAPLAAGTVWFQNYDGSPTKGGSASHYWYGTRATSSFDPKDTYGGTLVDYITDATNLNIAASGGGSDEGGVNNIYLCKAVNVEDPANNPDCTLSSLFGNCDGQKLSECKLNNITPEKGAYNVYITSAKPTSALDGLDGVDGGSVGVFPTSGAGTFSTNNVSAFCKLPVNTALRPGDKKRKSDVGAASYRGWTTSYGGYPFGCGKGCLQITNPDNNKSVYIATVDDQTGGPHIGDLWDSDPDTTTAISNLGGQICNGNLCKNSTQMMTVSYKEVDTSFCWH